MKKKIILSIIACTCIATFAQSQSWTVKGNSPTATDTLGNLTNQSINFITNNVSRMFIKNTGEVGIGNPFPTAALDVQSAGTTTLLLESSNGSANLNVNRGASGSDATLNYIDQGTSRWNLGMIGSGNYSINNVSAGTSPFTILSANNNIGIGTATPSDKLTVQTASDSYGAIHTDGTVSIGTYVSSSAGGEIGTKSNHPLNFFTNNSGPQVTLTPTGRFGIGTVSPTYSLDILAASTAFIRTKSSGGSAALVIDRATNADADNFYLRTNGTNNWIAGCTNNSNNFSFREGVSGADYLDINSGGNIGVGTSAPAAKLHIKTSAPEALRIDGTNGYISFYDSLLNYAGFIQNLGGDMSLGTTSTNTAGNIRFRTKNIEVMRITPTKYVGIGTTAPKAKLHIVPANGEAIRIQANGGYMSFYDGAGSYCSYIQNVASDKSIVIGLDASNTTGSIRFNTSTGPAMIITNTTQRVGINTSFPNGEFELSLDEGRKPSSSVWTITSDERLKNIEGSYTKGLNEIMKLNPIVYHYKNVNDRKFDERVLKTKNVGFSAQEVQKVFPECVGKDDDGYLNLNIHAILIAEVNAIKEQQHQIDTKDEQIKELQNQNAGIIQQLNEMKECLATLCNASQNKVTSNSNSAVEEARLFQNQPNPFSQSTVIKYFIPASSGSALIKIISHDGIEIKSITIHALGAGSIEINANSLSSGIYNYQLIVDGNTVDTRQMVLTK